MKFTKKTLLLLIGVIVLVTIVGISAVISFLNSVDKQPPEPPVLNLPSGKEITYSDIEGKLQEIKSDLNLVRLNEKTAHNGYEFSDPRYFFAGTFSSGKFKGFKRIISYREGNFGNAGHKYDLFATKDDTNYIVDGDPNSITSDTLDGKKYFWNSYNVNKVVKVAYIPKTHPLTIALDKDYGLTRIGFTTEQKKKDDFYYVDLLTDFSKLTVLKSNKNLKIYTQNLDPTVYYPSGSDDLEKSFGSIVNSYISNARFIVVDQSGLAYSYTLNTLTDTDNYEEDYKNYLAENEAYYLLEAKKNALLESGNKTEADKIKLPEKDYLYPPSLGLAKKEVNTSLPLFDGYWAAFRAPCATNRTEEVTLVKNISDDELKAIGTFHSLNLYVLVDKNHPLYELNYTKQVENLSTDGLKYLKLGQRPSYDKYISKNPLVFVKGPDKKIIALTENDYVFEQCGKPVLYLYPTKTTEVSVSFSEAMQLDKSIPTYHKGWKILAKPNGSLTDLQPEFTNCALFKPTVFGSEYARNACLNNNYPYLYWAGESLSANYPKINDGWIVEKSDLEKFINDKLDLVGLNHTEKTDMLSFWLPKMLVKDAPFYRISFLQTDEMNKIAPMEIRPIPKVINRIFLDFLPLYEEPNIQLKPQILEPFKRDGFTVVEWGGLNR